MLLVGDFCGDQEQLLEFISEKVGRTIPASRGAKLSACLTIRGFRKVFLAIGVVGQGLPDPAARLTLGNAQV